MKLRTILVTVVAGLTLAVTLAACSSEPPPPPEPEGPSQEELERMRADSIRRAREAEEARRRAEEAERRAERERQRRIEEARETLRQMVFFDYDESEIEPAAERVLRRKARILRANPQVELRVAGHADERGSTEYNLALGSRRAESVVQFFVNFGLDQDRFSTVSYGEERPLVDESNEEAWAQNRRVEFEITAGSNQISPVSSQDQDR